MALTPASWLAGCAATAWRISLKLGARIGAAAVATLGDYAGYPRLDLDKVTR